MSTGIRILEHVCSFSGDFVLCMFDQLLSTICYIPHICLENYSKRTNGSVEISLKTSQANA